MPPTVQRTRNCPRSESDRPPCWPTISTLNRSMVSTAAHCVGLSKRPSTSVGASAWRSRSAMTWRSGTEMHPSTSPSRSSKRPTTPDGRRSSQGNGRATNRAMCSIGGLLTALSRLSRTIGANARQSSATVVSSTATSPASSESTAPTGSSIRTTPRCIASLRPAVENVQW